MKKALIPVVALLLAGGITAPAMAADSKDATTLKSIGNEILVDYSQGKITEGKTYDEVVKTVGKVSIPSDSKLQVAINYNPKNPANFTLCAWDNKESTKDKALGYMAINGETTASLIDCEGFAHATLPTQSVKNFTPVTRPIMNTSDFEPADAKNSSNQATESEKTGFPLWLGILFGVLGLGVAIPTFIFFASKNGANRRKVKDAQSKNRAIWTNSTSTHDNVQSKYAEYLADPVQVLNYPKLNDKTDSTTKAFLTDLRTANGLRPSDSRVFAHRDPSDYSEAVNELSVSWDGALQFARKTQWDGFTTEEIERLKRAQSHLNKVLDPNGNEHERQASYRQLLKEIKGLIILPKTSLLAIEKKSQLQLQDKEFYENA